MKWKLFGLGDESPKGPWPSKKADPKDLSNLIEILCPHCGSKRVKPDYDSSDRFSGVHCLDCDLRGSKEQIGKQFDQPGNVRSTDLSTAPDFAAAVGAVAASSSMLDHSLCILAALIMRAPVWHVQPAFFAVASNRARTDMIAAAATQMLGSEKYKARLDDLLGAARLAFSKRNTFVHAVWGISNDSKVYVLDNVDAPHKTKYRRVMLKEINAVRDELNSARDRINKFSEEFSDEFPNYLFGVYDNVPASLRKKFSLLRPRQNPQGGRRQSPK